MTTAAAALRRKLTAAEPLAEFYRRLAAARLAQRSAA